MLIINMRRIIIIIAIRIVIIVLILILIITIINRTYWTVTATPQGSHISGDSNRDGTITAGSTI